MGFAEDFHEAVGTVRERALPSVVGIERRGPGASGLLFGDGLVVTSAHNVGSGATTVVFADGERAESTELISDPHFDLAVIKVATGGRGALEWSETAVELGTPVLAASNPGGRGQRLSFGMVSGVDRSFRGPAGTPIGGAFEHSAPLPRGSSGGPVVDLQGKLIGINTSREGEGLYQAMRADRELQDRIEALGRGERSLRAWLGVGLLPAEVTARLRRAVGLEDRPGLLVRHVAEGGPAEQAGARQGDLLVDVAGTELRHSSDLHRVLSSHRPDEKVSISLVRGAEQIELTATLASTPEREQGHGPGRGRFGGHGHFQRRGGRFAGMGG